MPVGVTYGRGAERDIDEAIAFLREENPETAERFRRVLTELDARLADHPLLYPAATRGVRRAWLHPFRYAVCYRFTGEGIIVVACFHASRDPNAVRDILRSRR